MKALNYHHLMYFWVTAREGGITRASRVLHLTQPTLSHQIRELEKSVGQKLFMKTGRNLEMTESGKMVFRYATEIFSLGREMVDLLGGRYAGHPIHFRVGVTDVISKQVVYRLLEPVLNLPDLVKLQVREDKTSGLLADLATGKLDVVLTDSPVGPGSGIKAFNHLLGQCGVVVFGSQEILRKHGSTFPACLHEAPFLMPSEETTLHRSLENWFATQGLRPKIIGEFDDTALLNAFGLAGKGFFAAPSQSIEEVPRHGQVQQIGMIPDIVERVFAISIEKEITHPAVLAIARSAQMSP